MSLVLGRIDKMKVMTRAVSHGMTLRLASNGLNLLALIKDPHLEKAILLKTAHPSTFL